MRVPQLTLRRAALLAVVPPLALLTWLLLAFVVGDNFHHPSADLYRSGQLGAADWQPSLASAGYRSVLNLRGAKPDAGWYRAEMAFAADHGLDHHDLKMSARTAPTLAEMQDLVAIMRRAPKPLLIHCKNGSDRSGLAAALYRYAVEGVPAEVAGQQLSMRYGHFPWLLSKSGAMDSAFAQFVAAQSAQARSGPRAAGQL